MTAKYLIIGGPSSGKTTVIDRLAALGYVTAPESARLILEELRIADPRPMRDKFQNLVFQRQLAVETSLPTGAPCFLDGGIFDGCAYYMKEGMEVPAMFDTISGARYACAFLFEPLDTFVHDGVRYQDFQFTKDITELLHTCYSIRGVKIVRIPNAPVADRIDAILQRLR